jgi:hypothetical protein
MENGLQIVFFLKKSPDCFFAKRGPSGSGGSVEKLDKTLFLNITLIYRSDCLLKKKIWFYFFAIAISERIKTRRLGPNFSIHCHGHCLIFTIFQKEEKLFLRALLSWNWISLKPYLQMSFFNLQPSHSRPSPNYKVKVMIRPFRMKIITRSNILAKLSLSS